MRLATACCALLALVVASTGCGDGEDGSASPPPAPAPAPAPSPPAETTTGTVAPAGPLRLERLVTGLEAPVDATAAPGEPNRVYVVEQGGLVRVLDRGRLRSRPFLDIRDDVRAGGEQGLLSLAFHPAYAENGRLYVDYTNRNGDTRVVEFRVNSEGTAVAAGTARELLAVDQPYSNHNGGQLAFGPDGLLYVGMGDGGAGGDPENRAQDLRSPLGKLLRLDVDGGNEEWKTAAYGLRNPWRFSWDRATDELYIADVGQSAREEVDWLPGPPDELVNFGWDVWEGDRRFEEKEPNTAGRLVEPVHVYGREEGCSITGGYVYRGRALPRVAGRYFFGDYCSGRVWSLRVENGRARGLRRAPFRVEALSSFGEDAQGELLLVSLAGTVYRLVA